MAIVSVSQLKTGEKLSENVLTKRGSLLLEKGKGISQREIDILRAFLISSVSIESKPGEEQAEQKPVPEEKSQSMLPFYKEYTKMVSVLKQVFNNARTSQTIPILDIRTSLERLIQQIDQYNILSFPSRNNHESDYMVHNSVMVAMTSYQLARWQGFPQKDWMQIALAGLFHDIGNMRVDDVIFEKKSKLTVSELEEMRKHTIYGYQLLKVVPAINEGVKLAALQHHEKEDGSGYPLGVKGDKIHAYAKVIAIADIYHAMTTNRRYKQAISPYLVLEELYTEAFGKLDPVLVQTFIQKLTSLHNGTLVKLNDNRIGEIIFSDRSYPTRPWVNVNGTIVNLTTERSLYIQEVITHIS